jgi:hypothetical protein
MRSLAALPVAIPPRPPLVRPRPLPPTPWVLPASVLAAIVSTGAMAAWPALDARVGGSLMVMADRTIATLRPEAALSTLLCGAGGLLVALLAGGAPGRRQARRVREP